MSIVDDEFERLYDKDKVVIDDKNNKVYRSLYEISHYWKIINIDKTDETGKVLKSKDGRFKMWKLSLVFFKNGMKHYIKFLCMEYMVKEFEVFDIIEFIEKEPALEITQKSIGVNKGQPRNYVDFGKLKDVKKAGDDVDLDGV